MVAGSMALSKVATIFRLMATLASRFAGAVKLTTGAVTSVIRGSNSPEIRQIGTPSTPGVGSLSVAAAAYHDLNDTFWGDNSALNVVNILNPATTNILALRLATRELAYDSVRDVLYASTPASNRLSGNLITVINPATPCSR